VVKVAVGVPAACGKEFCQSPGTVESPTNS
jgi:hypothetical protein